MSYKANLQSAENRLKLARTILSNAKDDLNIAYSAAETDRAEEEIGDLIDSVAGAMACLTGLPINCRKLWIETVEVDDKDRGHVET